MVLQDRHFILLAGEPNRQSWLKTAENVVGNFKRRFVLIHRHGSPKFSGRGDRDSGDNRFHITPIIEKRRERRPRLFVHPIAFVQYANATANHGRYQRRSVVGNLASLAQNGRDEQIFRTRVGRALIDVQRPTLSVCPGNGQLGFAHTWRTD